MRCTLRVSCGQHFSDHPVGFSQTIMWTTFLRLSCRRFSDYPVDNVSQIVLWIAFLRLSCGQRFSDYSTPACGRYTAHPRANSCTVVRFQTFLQLPVDVLHTSGWVNVCTFCLLEENVLGMIKELCECTFTLPCSLLAENVLGVIKQLCECTFTQPAVY